MAISQIVSDSIAPNSISANVISSVSNTAIAGLINASQISSIANTQITGTITAAQIVSVANTAITGNIINSQIASVSNTAITGVITSNQLVSSAQHVGFKNRLINGAMIIDQRNAGAATTNAISGYTVDRWYVQQSTTGKLIVQQNAGSITPPAGYTKYLGITSQSAYSVAAGDFYTLFQVIEGNNIADLAWGTANAKTITLSFQVYSSLTGTFGGSLRNSAGNRSYPFTYTISSASTWTTVSVTIAGDTSGTWATDNTAGIYVYFGLGVGTTYSGTAGAWAAGNYFSATGATSVVGTNGATFYITGVQFETGSQATSFDFRSYPTEFAMCQRYYETGIGYALGNAPAAGYYFGGPNGFRVTKRASPTVVLTTTNVYASSNLALGIAYVSGFNAYATSTSSSGLCETQGTYTASAEL
jgi:hypothetical protein